MVQFPKWQVFLVLAVLLVGIALASPNLIQRNTAESLPGWLPNKQVHLGLDLQGGSYLLLEVGLNEVFEDRRENLVDAIRGNFRRAKIGYTNLGTFGQSVGFDLRDAASLDSAREILRDINSQFLIDVANDTQVRVSLPETLLREQAIAIMNQTIEVLRRRIDELGTREPSIQRHGDDRILLQVPGIEDPEELKAIIGTTAVLTFRFVEEGGLPTADSIPAGSEILPAAEGEDDGFASSYVVNKRIFLRGDNLVDAQGTFQDGQPVVSFTFDTAGAKRFADITRDNVGRIFAIVLDDEVISAPVIREPILGGSGIISGSFTVQSAQNLALLLRAGALPAPISFLEERTVGAGLGADSIQAGKIACMLGFVFVIIFMALSYGRFGLMANVALLANLVLIVAALSGLQATLTLPGIAGIVLTIGMAVDANVLIFERIREEAHINGRSPVTAIDAGYRRAMTTIIDSNLTTLIAAVLLFQFGSGPIKGFAVTLAIGLVTSMFTAIMLTRLLIVTWLRRKRRLAVLRKLSPKLARSDSLTNGCSSMCLRPSTAPRARTRGH